MILVEAQLKGGIPARRVTQTRKRWVSEGKESKLRRVCRQATRHVVMGSSPKRVLWMLGTDQRTAANLIKNHFGSIWRIKISRVKTQTIGGAIKSR